jgi:hypothetical protein
MFVSRLLPAVAVAAAFASASPDAASAVTFTVDPGSVSITGADFCLPGNCTLEGGITGGSFDLNSVGESYNFTNLFNWNIENTGWFSQFNTGVGAYSISAILHFSDPSDATGTGSGYAGFVTLLGTVSAGFIDWTAATGTVDFGAIELDFVLHDAANIGFGTGASSGATFTLAAVPVPAGGLLLIGALGGLAALRRRKAA